MVSIWVCGHVMSRLQMYRDKAWAFDSPWEQEIWARNSASSPWPHRVHCVSAFSLKPLTTRKLRLVYIEALSGNSTFYNETGTCNVSMEQKWEPIALRVFSPFLYWPRPLQIASGCRERSNGNRCVKRKRCWMGEHENDQEREELTQTECFERQKHNEYKATHD